MMFIYLYYKKLKPEDKETFQQLIQPLFFRSLLSIFIAVALLVAGNYGIYSLFGPINTIRFTQKK
jgi:ABC-type Fe3+ transport system permease subunit